MADPVCRLEWKDNFYSEETLKFGPDVKDLQVGDKVLVIGQIGESVVQLPREKDLLITRQSNIILTMEEVKDDS